MNKEVKGGQSCSKPAKPRRWKNRAKSLLRSTSSGAARVLHARVERPQWPPLTEIRDLKKSKLFYEFPFSLSAI
jgi:hypothetical protein